jgi:Uma2 family endonuclease
MPTALTQTPPRPAPPEPPRKRWTRSEYVALESVGVFERQRLELVEGELIDKMGKKRPHVDAVALMVGWAIQAFGVRFVNSEAPIDVAPEDNPTNEPEPDLIVLKENYSGFRSETPQPRDLQLVVEVADTTLAFDLTIKAALYARAGIAEYWVLDVQGRRLVVHREPGEGRYGSVVAYDEHERVVPLSAPNSSFRVGDAFPA